jgi:hypothetical protein
MFCRAKLPFKKSFCATKTKNSGGSAKRGHAKAKTGAR